MLKEIIQDCDIKRCILHNGQYRVTIFAFEDNSFFPSRLIKIYPLSGKDNLDRFYGYLRRINQNGSLVLKESLPGLLDSRVSGKFYIAAEAYIRGASLDRYAASRSILWRRNFFINLKLATGWLSALHRDFKVGQIILSKDNVSFLADKVSRFLDIGFLNIERETLSMPTVIAHDDFMPINIIRNKNRIFVVDWDKMKPEGLPLRDLLTFVLHYLHSRYRFQKDGLYLRPPALLKYFSIFYTGNTYFSCAVRAQIDAYCKFAGINLRQKNILLLWWLYDLLYIYEENKTELLVLPRLLRL